MLTLLDEFCGLGGSTEGASQVPGVEPVFAANHSRQAIESHAANHPGAEHWLGDIQKVNVGDEFPRTDLFWSSPACPAWSDARGRRRTFDTSNQLALWAEELSEEQQTAIRSRALMEEIVLYLRACHDRGRPVLAGVVENVIQCRLWGDWDRWINEIRTLDYDVRVIALNSMHAQAPNSPRCPQSRDRLYVAYWHHSIGRAPDWDKWLRPRAWCPTCETTVHAMQVFKRPGNDMGRHGTQYTYRCPHATCRNHIVEPDVLPAAAIIDWSDPGGRIGDRPRTKDAPEGLKPATIARIRAGLAKYGPAITLEAAGHTFERTPGVRSRPVTAPLTTQTTTPTKALAVSGALMVPVEGRDGKQARPADWPMRTQTCRNETGIAIPFIERAYGADRPVHTVTAEGNHHGLATPPGAQTPPLLVPYYGNGNARPTTDPVGTLTTRHRYALVMHNNNGPRASGGLCTPADEPVRTITTTGHQSLLSWRPEDIDIADVLYRMLEPREIQAAMAFPPTYQVLPPAKRDRVRLLGNAVTPTTAEVIVSALTEAITGEELPR